MKPQTMAQKILARASGNPHVSPGEMVWCRVDRLMTHDPCSPGVIGIFNREFGPDAPIWDQERYIMIPDHFVYTTDPQANENVEKMRRFAHQKGVQHFYDVGSPNYKGVCHIALAEAGHCRPGELMVGTDSHTVTAGAFGTFAIGVGNTDAAYVLGKGEILLRVPETVRVDIRGIMPTDLTAKDLILHLLGRLGVAGATYQALEFCGETVDVMSVEERMTLCNMAIECGAKTALMVPNNSVLEFLGSFEEMAFDIVEPDPGAGYRNTLLINVSDLKPQVAKPHSPDNTVAANQLQGVAVDRVYLGSCTGGKKEDFRRFAKVLQYHRVAIDTYAVPATQEVLRQIILEKIGEQSIYEILLRSGVKISSLTGCAACCGGPKDTFGRINGPLRVVSTTNRNFPGRMGDKSAEIYLASPITAAKVAIQGTF